MKVSKLIHIGSILFLSIFVAVTCYADIIPSSREISWTPGIPGGIPVRTTIGANVQSFGAIGDGVADDTSEIQAAIDACPVNQVVFFPAGTYRITDTIRVNKSVVLRGTGPATRIMHQSTGRDVIIVGSVDENTPAINVTSGYSKGSNSITVQDSSTITNGDYIIITQLDDTSLITYGGATWYKRAGRSMGQILEVTEKNGNTLTIDPDLYYSYAAGFDPEIERTRDSGSNSLEYAGIENMYIYRTMAFGGQGHIIYMANCSYCWVKNVETNLVSGRHIQLERCFRCEVRDSYFHHAWNYDSGANAYGISVNYYSSDNLIENNITFYLNIPIALENAGGGNVIGYNYSDGARLGYAPHWQMADIGTHASHNYMDLIEGNMVTHITPDNTHGSSSHLTFLRNYTDLVQPYDNPINNINGFEIQANNLFINIVGNVIGTSGISGAYELNGTTTCANAAFKIGYYGGGCSTWDSGVSDTILRHGNFNYMTNSTHWDESISDHAIPWSYYYLSTPSWWYVQGSGRPWPPIGPDVQGYVVDIPAKDRFEGETYNGVVDPTIPSPPMALQFITP